MEKEKIIAEVIVDLMEVRASFNSPVVGYRKMQAVEDVFRYNFLNVIISNLMDKYSILDTEIREVIRNRSINEAQL